MNSLVSIITPSHNSMQFIPETIDSVMNQTYQNWELIIIDDHSQDNSVETVEKYLEKDNRIKLIRLIENSGPAVARNRGIQEAKGRYIAFLDSDDMWMPDKLSKQLSFMQNHHISLSFAGYYRIKEEDGAIIDYVSALKSVDYKELLKQNVIGSLTAIYDTDILGKVYMPEIRKRQDFALWLKILKKIPCARGLDEPLAYYRVRNESLSSNKIASSLYNWKMYRDIEKFPLPKAIYYFGWYTFRVMRKYLK